MRNAQILNNINKLCVSKGLTCKTSPDKVYIKSGDILLLTSDYNSLNTLYTRLQELVLSDPDRW